MNPGTFWLLIGVSSILSSMVKPAVSDESVVTSAFVSRTLLPDVLIDPICGIPLSIILLPETESLIKLLGSIVMPEPIFYPWVPLFSVLMNEPEFVISEPDVVIPEPVFVIPKPVIYP